MSHTSSYRDLPGLTSRANSALCRIEQISNDVSLDPGVRLVLIAEVMRDEPVLTDGSTAAYVVRAQAEQHKARVHVRNERARLAAVAP